MSIFPFHMIKISGDEKMKEGKKTSYNIWQNTWFMVKNAWKTRKSVPVLVVLLAAATAGQSVAELLVGPVLLREVEEKVPMARLILSVLGFTLILFTLTGLGAWLKDGGFVGRISVRMSLMWQIDSKVAGTSYPNTLDTEFINSQSKALKSTSANREATEAIWTTWTDILTNIFGFIVYLALLSGLHPLLTVVVIATTAAGYFVNKRFNSWGYRHRGEESACHERLAYIHRVATRRAYAKDIRVFGLRDWLEDVWDKTLGLYRAFVARREAAYLWGNVVDLLLSLLRNGIAYAYLITLTLTQGLAASEFLLYFNAVSGFTQWITGILEKFSLLHLQSLDISALREFLEWPEPFKFDDGEPLRAAYDNKYEICLDDVSLSLIHI